MYKLLSFLFIVAFFIVNPWFSVRSYSSPHFSIRAASNNSMDLSWHAPNSSHINDLNSVINASSVWGFVFNSSTTPANLPYSTYNWCNMPHVRPTGYVIPNSTYTLEYVHVIHRHHKRTPYAANTFPQETYPWSCSDEGLFYHASPFAGPNANASAQTYWSPYTSLSNPLSPGGFPGTCQFPQLTSGGLDDSLQHGRDIFDVYHSLLGFLTKDYDPHTIEFRVTNNVITSQVASMVIAGMYPHFSNQRIPLSIQPSSIDSLEPSYPCPSASHFFPTSDPLWKRHLRLSTPLFKSLDTISGVSSTAKDWHTSWDHYFDNLSSRLCHSLPLPCSSSNKSNCISQSQANAVFRLGEWEYNHLYRSAGPQTLEYARRSYGIWIAELAASLRAKVDGDVVRFRHNIAHDGSLARLLAILQVEEMVWPGMGSEIIFELYSTVSDSESGKEGASDWKGKHWFLRILWGGRVLKSSSPVFGRAIMVPLERVLAYFDRLVGIDAVLVPGLCGL